MRTNQNLVRKMGEFDVMQRTKDGMFNATALLKQWNKSSGMKKVIAHFFENASTEEYVNVLITKENLKDRNSVYLKSRGKYGGGTWMHPFLFIDFAMWLNAEFKYEVIKFVYDQLIQYRNDAGNTYKSMAAAICKITPKGEQAKAIQDISKANNHIVYGSHEKEIRNKQAEESKVKELTGLQTDITKLINDGFISSYDSLMSYLRKKWRTKYEPEFLTN